MDANALKQFMERRCGRTIVSASDFDWLVLDFKAKTGETISKNTLKRLLGFLEYDGKSFRPSTLNVVARYLGFKDWSELEMAGSDGVSVFGDNPDVLNSGNLAVGDVVTVLYRPNHKIVFEYQGDDRFVVVKSENSKLQEADIATIHQLVLGYPLQATDVERSGKSLGEYSSTKIGEITDIKVKGKNQVIEHAENQRLYLRGSTCDTYVVRINGKLHFKKKLKVQYKGMPQYQEAFRKEYEVGSRLEHPALPKYVAIGNEDGCPYILEEYIEGDTLTAFLENNPDYYRQRRHADAFIDSLLSVMRYLHEHQVVYLDLKPDNVMITTVGHQLRLIDLGGSRTDMFTNTDAYTQGFASPEQLDGHGNFRRYDERTDIWLIGRLMQFVGVPSIYNKVVARCLKPDPQDRYADIEALQRAVKRVRRRRSTIKAAVIATACLAFIVAMVYLFSKPSTQDMVIKTGGGPIYEFLPENKADTAFTDKDIVGLWLLVATQQKDIVVEPLQKGYYRVKYYGADGEYGCAAITSVTIDEYSIRVHEYGTYTYSGGIYSEMGRAPVKGGFHLTSAVTANGVWEVNHEYWRKITLSSEMEKAFFAAIRADADKGK